MNDERLGKLLNSITPIDAIRAATHPKSSLVHRCLDAVDSSTQQEGTEAVAFFVPGRIEVLGKHTDYCGGRSLLCAIDAGFVFVARPRADERVRVIAALSDEQASFALAPDIEPAIGHWSNYPMTVARRLARNFGRGLRGIDMAFASDLPPAAGLSSSSAFIIGAFLSIASLNRLHTSPAFIGSITTLEDLAHYCGCIENGSAFGALAGDAGVGTSGGSQDHTAILCCKPNTLSVYGFSPVTHEADVPFPTELALVSHHSSIMAEKTGSSRERYNAVSRKVKALVQLWNDSTSKPLPTLAAIVRSDASAAKALHRLIDDRGAEATAGTFAASDLHDRLAQFIAESEQIIPAATAALRQGDLASFGRLVKQSVEGAVDKLRNQVPQTIALTQAALTAGAVAASPFGAGFGGSVWAMYERSRLESSLASVQRAYPSGAATIARVTGGATPIS